MENRCVMEFSERQCCDRRNILKENFPDYNIFAQVGDCNWFFANASLKAQ